jgi:iron(III) transport system substrate-binding protein
MKKKSCFLLVMFCTAFWILTPPAFAGAKKVVLYTAHGFEIITPMVAAFEKETGLKTEVLRMTSGEIIQRALAEKGNPRADVIWSIGGEMLESNHSILAKYTPKEWDKIDATFKVGTNWFPYTVVTMVFIVNTKQLSEDRMPRKWTDLGRNDYREMVSVARADKSGSSYMQLVTVLNIYKEKGWDVYTDMLKNAVLCGSSGTVPKMVNAGEASIGITLEDNAYRYVRGGGNVRIIYPEDGTTSAPDGLALVKNGPSPEMGKAFIDWALSQKTQKFLVDTQGRRSVRVDVPPSGSLPPIDQLKIVPYDFAASSGSKKATVKKWTETVMELGI